MSRPQGSTKPDFLVIGGGIVGLTLARALSHRYADASITIAEKEPRCGMHASSRNSGVLHAGFYYTADSLKAKLTVEGNRRMTAFCVERGLPINRCGKLVVPINETELTGLDELARRAEVNGVDVRMVSAEEALSIAPGIGVFGRALHSPTTSTVAPGPIIEAMVGELAAVGVDIRCDTRFLRRDKKKVYTNTETYSPGYVINAAGLYADVIAHSYGFGERFVILPFKGVYAYQTSGPPVVSTNIYPVPELNYPWLGVHLTVTSDGVVKLGPTAIPSFWREHYKGFNNFRLREFIDIVGREARYLTTNAFGFRSVAWRELRKYDRRHLVALARGLLPNIDVNQFARWGPAGIRAQLVDVHDHTLEMDFQFEGDDQSFHVLNAVSPAFTCSLAFADLLADEIAARLT